MSQPSEPNKPPVDDFTVFEPFVSYDSRYDHYRLLLVFGEDEAQTIDIGLSRKSLEKLRVLCSNALQIQDLD